MHIFYKNNIWLTRNFNQFFTRARSVGIETPSRIDVNYRSTLIRFDALGKIMAGFICMEIMQKQHKAILDEILSKSQVYKLIKASRAAAISVTSSSPMITRPTGPRSSSPPFRSRAKGQIKADFIIDTLARFLERLKQKKTSSSRQWGLAVSLGQLSSAQISVLGHLKYNNVDIKTKNLPNNRIFG